MPMLTPTRSCISLVISPVHICQTYIIVSTFQVTHDRHVSDVVLLGPKYRSQTVNQQTTSEPKSLPLSYLHSLLKGCVTFHVAIHMYPLTLLEMLLVMVVM